MALLLISVLLLTGCNNFIHELIPLEPGEELPQPPVIYTVTFDKNGGDTDASPAAKTVTVPATRIDALPAAEPAWAGHTFEGWWTKNGDGGDWGIEFTAEYTVTADITVYAKWTINTYTVTFDKNGGTTEASPTSNTSTYGGTVLLPTTAPTLTSHTFEGWWMANGSGGNWGEAFTATTTVTADITVYAKWNPPPNYYMVTFNKNNTDSGSTEADPQTASVADGGTVNPLPTAPARTGYTFSGWNTAADGSGIVFDETTPVTADITVYAKWTINTYTVTFDKNGGTTEASPTSRSVTHGGTVSLPTTNPTRTGYTFVGWNAAADGSGTAFTATTVVTADITVYAQWTANTYTVTFDKNGGTTEASPTSNTTTYGGTVSLPTQPTKTGYGFIGWNAAADGSGTAFTATTVVTADITVYAQWTANTYTVTFDKNGGDTEASPTSRSVTHGGTVSLPTTAPAWAGYTFSGWNTAADGSGTAFTTSTPVMGDITVYAQWAAISPLILVINGSSGSFTIPTNNTWAYDWTIDWGDGNIDTVTGTGAADAGISHTYTSNPQYTIEITANSNTGHAAFGFGSGSGGANATANKQRLLKALGHINENTSVTDFPNAWSNCFNNCTNLNEVSPNLLPAVPNGTSSIFYGMFEGCAGLSSLPAGFQLPAVSNGTSFIFSRMFSGCTNLSSLPAAFQLPAVPNGTSYIFASMFSICTNLSSLPAAFQLPAVPNGTSYIFWDMFLGCTSLSSLPAAFQLPAVPNGTSYIFRGMFANCTNLSSLPAAFQLPAVPNGTSSIFSEMFAVCTNLSSLPAAFQLPAVPNGTSQIFSEMFYGCSSLSSLPAGFQLPAIPNGTIEIFGAMFAYCTNLSSLPAAFQLPAVPNGTSQIFYRMFDGCTNLSSLPAAFQLPAVPNGTSYIFNRMFYGCTKLSSLPAAFQLPAVPNGTSAIFNHMFYGCSALNTNIEDLIGPNIFSPGQLDSTFMYDTFFYCSNLTGSASNALSMGFYGNTTTPLPTPSVDLNTFRGCPASVTAGLHTNWR
ncbi:hypothetical protein FACS1894163_00790 [Spirochaetia bacterium]|nr:hypothetical protein FACS1894163_00790 [Spirochaetia bacterium]